MSAVREEAAVVAASASFQSDPATVINSHVARAMTAYWSDQPATAKHHAWMALVLTELADNPSVEVGASLGALRTLYGEAPA